jgi:hypothetical protein
LASYRRTEEEKETFFGGAEGRDIVCHSLSLAAVIVWITPISANSNPDEAKRPKMNPIRVFLGNFGPLLRATERECPGKPTRFVNPVWLLPVATLGKVASKPEFSRQNPR